MDLKIKLLVLFAVCGLSRGLESSFESFLIKGSDEGFSKHIPINVAADARPDTIKVKVVVVSSMLGSSLSSSDEIDAHTNIQQVVSSLMTNAFKLQYLSSMGMFSNEKRVKGQKNLEAGLKMLKEVQQWNGAFKLRNNSESAENVWFTASVVKCLSLVKRFYVIDDKMLINGFKYLKSRQTADGGFTETGETINEAVQGSKFALTSYVAIAFLGSKQYVMDSKKEIDLAINYINLHASEVKTNFEIAIAAYALHLARHQSAAQYLQALYNSAVKAADESVYWEVESKATKVETASYAILAFLEGGREIGSFPIAKWIITNMNAKGNFESPQETVIAVQAITKMAETTYGASINMTVSIEAENQFNNITIQKQNGVHSFEFQSSTRSLTVRANGTGLVFFQSFVEYEKL